MADEETDLIHRASEGDHRAFGLLVRRYDARILRLTCEVAGNEEDGRDICQEVLVAAYRALPGFRMQSSFFTWLYRIAVNKALKFRSRRASRPDDRPISADSPNVEARVDDIPTSDASPEERLLDQELADRITAAQSALSPKERMSFVLCHREDYPIRDAASLMGCSDGAVKSYLFRARAKMKQSLTTYLEG